MHLGYTLREFYSAQIPVSSSAGTLHVITGISKLTCTDVDRVMGDIPTYVTYTDMDRLIG